MEYTIREMIDWKGRALQETDYAHSNAEMLDFRLFSGDFYEWEGGKLRFKECANVMDFAQVSEAFPPFGKIRYRSREKFPYFTGNLDTLRSARENGETIAVEGGPCLFGENEVSVTVGLRSGETRRFDYASGKAYLNGKDCVSGKGCAKTEDGEQFSRTGSLADYLGLYGGQVEDISFRPEKRALTPQEYFGLRLPFEVAAALDGPLVIPIPDMSYRKYLLAVLDCVPEALRAGTLAEFDAITERITALYLDAIDKLQSHFQIRRFCCVRGADRDTLETWYEKRAPYIERGKVLRGLTRAPEKIEPVKDYISMPALPFYLFDARYILEVNSVDEVDSYRKCKKAHKKDLQMGCILMPELLSGDGVHTLYNAPLPWKGYGNYDDRLST